MTATAEKLRADAQQARKTLIGVLVRVTEGKTVPDSALTQARQAADVTAAEAAKLLDILATRKEACDEFEQINYAQELADLMEERRTLPAEIQEAEKNLAETREQLRLLHERLTGAVNRSTMVQNQRTAAAEKRRKVLAATGGKADWRDIA